MYIHLLFDIYASSCVRMHPYASVAHPYGNIPYTVTKKNTVPKVYNDHRVRIGFCRSFPPTWRIAEHHTQIQQINCTARFRYANIDNTFTTI